jgi:AraC-like DNA-binding protein
MAYDPRLLFARICICLDETPSCSLIDLAKKFQVDIRTIDGVVTAMTAGGKFGSFKDDILIAKLTRLFLARPTSSMNELSLELGYKSARTFARAVWRACGASPATLRRKIASEVAAQKAKGAAKAAAKV